MDLLSLTALPPGAPIPGDELFLVKPIIPRVNPVGVAWPIYAILTETVYPKRSPQVPASLQKYLKEMWDAEVPLNPKGIEVKKGLANVILLGREAALKAGTVSEEELDRQGYSGFVIRADNGAVTIAGQTRHGTAYGMYRYLEQHGFKFYANDCVKAPRLAAKIMQACELDDRPYFDGRRQAGGGYDPVRDTYGGVFRVKPKDKS